MSSALAVSIEPVMNRATDTIAIGEAEPRMALEICTDFVLIEAQWREFEQIADCTVFQSFDWLAAWHCHIGCRKNLTPIVVIGQHGSNGVLTFLLPLAVERRGMVRRLIWLGSDLCDYNAPLLAPNFREAVKPGQFVQIWNDIVLAIQSDDRLRFDVVDFEKMPTRIGDQPNPFLELPTLAASFSGHAATLPVGDWDAYYSAKVSTPKSRATDRRKFKNLAKLGALRFREITEPNDVEKTIAALIQEKRDSYARMGVADIFNRPGYPEFFYSVGIDDRLRGIVHITRLDVGDDIVATALCLQFRGCYYLLFSSYEEKYGKYSPGRKHLFEMLQFSIKQKLQVFDFTIGDEPYKLDWSDIETPLLSYVECSTVWGWGIVLSRRLRHRFEAWYNRPHKLARTKRVVKSTKRLVIRR